MSVAVVPGTFDPITNGHLDVISRAAKMFDEIVVAVAESQKKGPMFSHEDRISLAREACKAIPNVRVEGFTGLLVDFSREIGADIIVKGLRTNMDFEYEFQQAFLNHELAPELEAVFVMSNPGSLYLSSSVVREISTMNGDVSAYVPSCVLMALEERKAAQ